MSDKPTLTDSPYRYIVVPRGTQLYGVRDRSTGRLILDDVTRAEARRTVWDLNGRHGAQPEPWKANER